MTQTEQQDIREQQIEALAATVAFWRGANGIDARDRQVAAALLDGPVARIEQAAERRGYEAGRQDGWDAARQNGADL